MNKVRFEQIKAIESALGILDYENAIKNGEVNGSPFELEHSTPLRDAFKALLGSEWATYEAHGAEWGEYRALGEGK
jgi:hypothetical protein